MPTLSPSRRALLRAGAWSSPVLLASSPLPAYAASAPAEQNLALEFSQPNINWETFEPIRDVPIYRGATGSTLASKGGSFFNPKASYGSLPTHLIIRNEGSQPVSNPSGSLLSQMKDVASDSASAALIGTQVNSSDPQMIFTYTGQASPFGPSYDWTYQGVLGPGQTLEIPLRYYVTWPFANVDYELFLAATVLDPLGASQDNTSEIMGTVNGFTL
ncbi:MAG: hypothetical protein SOR40_02695 [Rothia sp. (in: high G+C Gram-positive bacteria)]|nr:hypothetical protein [Rothia sp. (in: high G+C Gram-positive bacteria)]